MKKIAIVLFVLLTFSAGTAMAAFDASTLTLAIYDNVTTDGNTEFGMNTGFSLDLDLTQPIYYQVDTGLDLGWWAEGTEWSSLNVGMLGYDAVSTEDGEFYFTTTSQSTTTRWDNTGTTGLMSAVNMTLSGYNNQLEDMDATTILLGNNLTDGGYDDWSNSNNGTPGYYGNGNMVPTVGEGNLANFGDADPNNDFITLYLHGMRGIPPVGWNDASYERLSNGILVDENGNPLEYLATVTLTSDGMLTISNAPVPGALWLLGSGLLGLLGLRRKNA